MLGCMHAFMDFDGNLHWRPLHCFLECDKRASTLIDTLAGSFVNFNKMQKYVAEQAMAGVHTFHQSRFAAVHSDRGPQLT